MDASWADVSTSDFEKPHPLMISVSDIDSRRGAGYLREGPQDLDKQRRGYTGPTEYNPDVYPRRCELDQTLHARDMSFQLEKYGKINVSNESGTAAVHGYPDYSLWYGIEEAVETNLVIVEAKAEGLTGSTEAQQLVYMCEWKKVYVSPS